MESRGRLILKRLRQSELGFFEACRLAGRETGRQRALNIDADVVEQVFGVPTSNLIEVTTRWFDGVRIVEDARPIRLQQKNWRLGGAVVEGERFSAVNPDDIVMLHVHERATEAPPVVTWDVVSQAAEETWSLFEVARRALGAASSVVVAKDEQAQLMRIVERRLKVFGATGRFDTGGLSDEDWDRCIAWLEALPPDVLDTMTATGTSRQAEIVLAELGDRHSDRVARNRCEELLRRFGDELLADGRRREALRGVVADLDMPQRWDRGSPGALSFVARLGLPPSMAGAPSLRPPDWEEVEAWQPLGPLHEYQTQVARQVEEVLQGGTWDKRRAVVWLPTGTGKTRVTVETLLMRCILQPPRNCILWVADRDELCEQALETFRHVWMVMGRETRTAASGTAPSLHLIRLWGGRSWRDPGAAPTVVVASIQTLARRLEDEAFREELAILAERCAAVVFDEAHHVVAASYGQVMEQLGLSRTRNYLGRNRDTGPPVLGLTATPARTVDDETERLSRRFSGRLIEPDGDWRTLARYQREGFLSRLEIAVVETGYQVRLTEPERRQLSLFQALPDSALARVGQDAGRTARIVADLERRLVALHAVLVFACSVDHAHVLADVLSLRGVPAAALDGTMPRPVRWKTIQRFRAGELQVLVNCDLLATGFDAPNIDAVVIARPIESSVLLAQMIGRGLRGPKNGGTERCLLVDCEDVLEEQGDLELLRHGFRHAFLTSAAMG